MATSSSGMCSLCWSSLFKNLPCIGHLSVFLARTDAAVCCHSQVKTGLLSRCIYRLGCLPLPAWPQFGWWCFWVSVVFLSSLFKKKKKKCWVARFITPMLHKCFCIGIRGDRSNEGARITSEKARDGDVFYEDHRSSNATWVLSTAKMTNR